MISYRKCTAFAGELSDKEHVTITAWMFRSTAPQEATSNEEAKVKIAAAEVLGSEENGRYCFLELIPEVFLSAFRLERKTAVCVE